MSYLYLGSYRSYIFSPLVLKPNYGTTVSLYLCHCRHKWCWNKLCRNTHSILYKRIYFLIESMSSYQRDFSFICKLHLPKYVHLVFNFRKEDMFFQNHRKMSLNKIVLDAPDDIVTYKDMMQVSTCPIYRAYTTYI